MSIPSDHDVRPTDGDVHRSRTGGSTTPEVSDHGAWDGPTVASAPDDAVRGGITSVARGVGAGLGMGVHVLRKAGSALGVGRAPGRGHDQH